MERLIEVAILRVSEGRYRIEGPGETVVPIGLMGSAELRIYLHQRTPYLPPDLLIHQIEHIY